MRVIDTDPEDLRRYLLGQLPEEEAERMEARLLEDDEVSALAESVEEELLIEHFRGELPEGRDLVDRLSASASGRRRVADAQDLVLAIELAGKAKPEEATPSAETEPAPSPKVRPIWERPAPRAILAGSMAAALIAGIGLGLLRVRTSPPPPGTPAVTAQLEPPPAVLLLSPSETRGSETSRQVLDLKPEQTRAELKLLLDGESFPSYRVSLTREDGSQVPNQVKTDVPGFLVAVVRAADLPGGVYRVRMDGVPRPGETELLAENSFQVIHRSKSQ